LIREPVQPVRPGQPTSLVHRLSRLVSFNLGLTLSSADSILPSIAFTPSGQGESHLVQHEAIPDKAMTYLANIRRMLKLLST
jgi:hypothetical protein